MSPIFPLLLIFLGAADALRILMFTRNVGYSHLGFTGSLADALVDAGHEVDYVIPMWNQDRRTNGTRKANVIRFYGKNMDRMAALLKTMVFFGDAFERDFSPKTMVQMNEIHRLHCDSLLSDTEFIERLRLRNYAMGFGEFFEGCSFGIFEVLGIPIIHEMSACPVIDNLISTHRLPVNLNQIPVYSNYDQATPVQTITERIFNIYEYLYQHLTVIPNYYKVVDRVFSDHGYSIGSIQSLQDRTVYVWLNTFEVVDFARSLSPKLKYVGGMAVRPPAPLDSELREIMDSAAGGVVLVSFGSVVDTAHLKPFRRDILLSAFGRFPDLIFVWKVSGLETALVSVAERLAPNVRLVEWMPQSSLLFHPNTKAFITHMGMNSLNEAAAAGVPMVAVPFFGDQQLNTAMAIRRGVARFVDRRSLSVASLSAALHSVLNEPKYREAARDVSAKIAAAPFAPQEIFTKHVDFAAKFKSFDEFRLPDEPLYQRWQLDIIGIFLVLMIFGFLVIWRIFGFAASAFRMSTRKAAASAETKKSR